MTVLVACAYGILAVAAATYLAGRIRRWQLDGLWSIGAGLLALDEIRRGAWFDALVNGAICAWWVHRWWRGGGGDDTKRRLRTLGRKFAPVRRTAPQGA